MRRAAVLLAMLASACTTMEPRYVRPSPAVPASWPVGDAYLRQSEAVLPSVTYRQVFRDARLQALIEQALINNRDLQVAAANIVAARARYRIQRAGQFPQVDPEFVVAADPQVILLLDAPFGVTAADVRARPGWDGIAAVRNDTVIELSEDATDALSRAGPRLAEAVRILAELLHPDLF